MLIRAVQPGQAAERAGINPGDILTAINGKPTKSLDALQTVLADLAPGQEATAEVTGPDGQKRVLKVTLGRL